MRTMNVILAEDSLSDASLVKIALEELDFPTNLRHFEDGESCVDFINSCCTNIDLFILDIRLPKLNGNDILVRLKNSACYGNHPVIMMSTTDNPAEIEKCIDGGADRFITKPFEVEDYITAVQKAVRAFMPAELEMVA